MTKMQAAKTKNTRLKPSEIFVKLARLGPVPYGEEDAAYGKVLGTLGFAREPGVYVLNPKAPVILAAHLDTVDGKPPSQVRVSSGGIASADGMMGADDKAGVSLILAIAAHGVPDGVGLALFLGEEVGCEGAKEAKANGFFAKARAVISLDRKGTVDIIYAQAGQATASREAARWLADKLGMGHIPSANGVWTDSAILADVVPECLNIAVGYTGAHSDNDTQDLRYLDRLYEALLRVPWAEFPAYRKPEPVAKWRWWDWDRYEYGPLYEPINAREVIRRLKEAGWTAEEVLELVLEENPDIARDLLDAIAWEGRW